MISVIDMRDALDELNESYLTESNENTMYLDSDPELQLFLYTNKYEYDDGLYIGLKCIDKEYGYESPYAHLTVNIPDESYLISDKDTQAFVSTNNFPQAEDLIRKYNLGEPTGEYGQSGFCEYPLYQFNMDEVNKYVRN